MDIIKAINVVDYEMLLRINVSNHDILSKLIDQKSAASKISNYEDGEHVFSMYDLDQCSFKESNKIVDNLIYDMQLRV